MRIAVTGSSGLIGSAFADAVRQDGDEVIRLVRRPAGPPTRSPGTRRPPAAGSTRRAGRPRRRPQPGRCSDRRQPLDARPQGRAAGQQDPGHGRPGRRAHRRGPAAGHAVVRVRHRLVLRHRRPRGGRVGARRCRIPGRTGQGLGSGRGTGSRGGHSRRHPAHRHRAGPPGRDAGQAGPAVPARPRRPDRAGNSVHQLDRAHRSHPGAAVPARESGHRRPGQPHRAEPGHQQRFHCRAREGAGRPALLRAPAPVLRAALGELSSDLLASARVIPRALVTAGFTFEHAHIASALAAELRPDGQGQPAGCLTPAGARAHPRSSGSCRWPGWTGRARLAGRGALREQVAQLRVGAHAEQRYLPQRRHRPG